MNRTATVHPSKIETETSAGVVDAAAIGADIAEVHSPQDLRTVVGVLSRIWQTPAAPIIDLPVLTALTHAGNPVFLARVGGEAVGAAMGFCGPPGTPFHSHIVGFLPEAAGHGFGNAIKLAQRAWCLDRGITEMTWTFDPLVCRNAYFNVSRLGASPIEYLPDFYGQMSDSINAGEFSDRMLILWDLTLGSDRTSVETGLGLTAAIADQAGSPSRYRPPEPGVDVVVVAVPWDIEAMRGHDPVRAHAWRLATRAAFTDLLDNGWRITGFVRHAPDHGGYVFRRP